MAKESEFVSISEAAEALGVSDRQVRNLIAAGILVADKVGRNYIIRRIDVAKVPSDRKPGPKPKLPAPAKKPRRSK